ncbi:hypothetical protein BKA67DRAFT_269662 [Truncatella angustata]|uniref:Uncharacterized protein n=1 Tax=Truncatella angustata TaxID=152316 RepID=A0A9P8UKY3_9PEZI|nr:uncharacterized protein BKA67DRAFT_269662 [Truncatella angustata]KAH6654088.1 hypothetical protein BKA67DRAFT_269662 [Truncatella angustata]
MMRSSPPSKTGRVNNPRTIKSPGVKVLLYFIFISFWGLILLTPVSLRSLASCGVTSRLTSKLYLVTRVLLPAPACSGLLLKRRPG